jgi:hypothetical protein
MYNVTTFNIHVQRHDIPGAFGLRTDTVYAQVSFASILGLFCLRTDIDTVYAQVWVSFDTSVGLF